MRDKKPGEQITESDDSNYRIQILEEKFEYQERTIDTLNEVIIEQQSRLDSLEEKIHRLQALLMAIEDTPNSGEDPPPPHY